MLQIPRPAIEELARSEFEAELGEATRPKKNTRRSKKAVKPGTMVELRRGCSKKIIPAAPEPSSPAVWRRKAQLEEDSEETKSDDNTNLLLDERIRRKARDGAHAKDIEEALSRWKEAQSTGLSSVSASGSIAEDATQIAKGVSESTNPTPLESTLKLTPQRPHSNPSIDRAVPKQPATKQPQGAQATQPAVESSTTISATPTSPQAAKRCR